MQGLDSPLYHLFCPSITLMVIARFTDYGVSVLFDKGRYSPQT